MPRENEVLQKVKAGNVTIGVRLYGCGRYGYEIKIPGEPRIRRRLESMEKAIARAKVDAAKLGTGRADLMKLSPDRVAAFLKWEKEQAAGAEVPTLVKAFLASKKTKGRSEWTIDSLEGVLIPFARDFTCAIQHLKRDQVEKWLQRAEDGGKVGPRRFNNKLAAVVALHRFARRDRLIGTELTPIEQIERQKTTAKKETYTPEELIKILSVVEKEWLPAIVLGAFCGVRPEEIAPDPRTEKECLTWENFLWRKKKIDLPASVSKVGQRRFVPLCDAAIAFLSDWKDKKGPTVPQTRLSNNYQRWSKAAKVTWKSDALRHSYASYRLAVTQDMAALSLEMGNSVKMIRDHYLDLKHEDEAEQWFGIRPKRPANVLELVS